jgi:signal transduction histidine kinase
VFVSARGEVTDRLRGFELGGDDYLRKPFALAELVARVRAVTRGRSDASDDTVLRVGDLALDLRRRRAERGGCPIELPRRQFDVLEFFMRRPGLVVSRSMLVEAGRSEPYWVLALRAGDAGWVQVTLYSRSFVRRAHRVRYAFLAGLPLAAIVSLIVGGVLARASFRPISGMLDSVRAIRGGALDVRVPVRGTGDELDQIAVAFNGALDRLEASMEALMRFSHDAAHQLRSPLTALRGRIEVAQHAQPASGELRPLLDGLLEDATRLSELVDAILALSRTSAGLRTAQRQAVDLATLVGEVVEFFEPLAREKGIALGTRAGDLGARATVSGDPAWLHQLFVNLVENAIHFTGPGGRIEVALRREAGDAVVELRDTGRGIPPAELERVFERFHRLALPGDEPGVGLGLPLAREIARIHGGDVTAASVAGVGSTFSVRLPLASGD